VKRDRALVTIEEQVRQAIHDAVNRTSRKPFTWGGLAGYDQLDAIAQALHRIPSDTETTYLRSLIPQVDRALELNRPLVDDVRAAHSCLRHIADCLHYPPDSTASQSCNVASHDVRQEMEALLAQFRPDPKEEVAQAALQCAWHRVWKAWESDLLRCYDVAGLPPDNLRLESFFNRIRQHQRRVSGHASTRPLGALGAYQVLFVADSEHELLAQLRQVRLADYQTHRQRVAQGEASRQQRYRFHHDPAQAIQSLLDQHATRRATLAASQSPEGP
jgi:hypothetical protein